MSNSSNLHFFHNGSSRQPGIHILQMGYTSVPDWSYQNITSPFWYLWQNPQPGSFVRWQSHELALRPDCFTLIPPYTLFSTHTQSSCMTQFHIHFFLESFQVNVKRCPIRIPMSSVTGFGPAEYLRFLHERPRSGFRLYFWAHSLISALFSSLPEDCLASENPTVFHPLTTAFMEAVTQHFSEADVFRAFCQRHHISQSTLLRTFKRDLGLTPQQYVMSFRMCEAKKMLTQQEPTIDEIAERIGFSDRYHFSKMFRKYVSSSPGAYRRSYLSVVTPLDRESREGSSVIEGAGQ